MPDEEVTSGRTASIPEVLAAMSVMNKMIGALARLVNMQTPPDADKAVREMVKEVADSSIELGEIISEMRAKPNSGAGTTNG